MNYQLSPPSQVSGAVPTGCSVCIHHQTRLKWSDEPTPVFFLSWRVLWCVSVRHVDEVGGLGVGEVVHEVRRTGT